MVYGSQFQQPQVQITQAVGGPDPNRSGQFPASPTAKQKQQQQRGGPQQTEGSSNVRAIKGGSNDKPSPLQRYLNNDPTYQSQTAAYQQALADYRNQIFGTGQLDKPRTWSPTSTLGQILEQFRSTKQNLNMQRQQDVPQINSDYASRGLMSSGLFAKARTDYQSEFQKQLQDLINSKQSNISDVLNSLTQFRHQVGAQRHQARLEALRRRAAQLGLGG